MDVGDPIIPLAGQVPAVPAVSMVVDGVECRLSLLSTSGAATQIAFVASERMDGGMLECGTTVEGSPLITETLILQIGSIRGQGVFTPIHIPPLVHSLMVLHGI